MLVQVIFLFSLRSILALPGFESQGAILHFAGSLAYYLLVILRQWELLVGDRSLRRIRGVFLLSALGVCQAVAVSLLWFQLLPKSLTLCGLVPPRPALPCFQLLLDGSFSKVLSLKIWLLLDNTISSLSLKPRG